MNNDGAEETNHAEWLSGYLDFGAALAGERLRNQESWRETLRTFIEVMDSFDRFFAATGSDASLPHLRTVRLIAKQYEMALQRAGAIPIDCEGREAEPGLHEVVGTRAMNGANEDTIVETLARGYIDAQGEPIRKARVIVAVGH